MTNILVTGCAGFIGAATTYELLKQGHDVRGIDNLNDYYSIKLKMSRLNRLIDHPNFSFKKIDICDLNSLSSVFSEFAPTIVIHLAAQAGVRQALSNPHVYADSNLVGFLNVIDESRKCEVSHFVFASSSSVYGLNKSVPFTEYHDVQHPISLYAATKLANEAMAHAYSYSFNLRCSGLRFFTVYGPWGRPDMAPMKFADAILKKNPIELYNNGDHYRDFTYIDDIVNGIIGLAMSECMDGSENTLKDNPGSSPYPLQLFNIGGNIPVKITEFLDLLEEFLGKKTTRILSPRQIGDVDITHASTDKIFSAVGWKVKTDLATGISNFASWAKENPDLLC